MRTRMDLDETRSHPDDGHGEHPWVGQIVVQWEECRAGEIMLHDRVVWSGRRHWDAPGYASEEAENNAATEAANRLADVLTLLCSRPGGQPPQPADQR